VAGVPPRGACAGAAPAPPGGQCLSARTGCRL